MAVDKTTQISGMILNSIVKMFRGLIGLENLSVQLLLLKLLDKVLKWDGKRLSRLWH